MSTLPGFTGEAGLITRPQNHYRAAFATQINHNQTMVTPAAVRLVGPISSGRDLNLVSASLTGWEWLGCMFLCMYACEKTGSPDCYDLCDYTCTML